METYQQPTYQSSGFTRQEIKPISWKTWLKIGYIIGFTALFLLGAAFFTKKLVAKNKTASKEEVLLEVKYQPVLWKDFGQVFEPIVKIPIYYPNKGFVKESFLLDSGALVSSLTREKAKQLGFSLAKLPRSTFAGFGGTTSFAYKASLKIRLGDQEATIPVVFTEAAGTKSILGRSGFFENYSIHFNSKEEKIEIRK